MVMSNFLEVKNNRLLSDDDLINITGAYNRKGAITAIGEGAMAGAGATWETGWGVNGGISIGAAIGGIGYIIHG